MLVVTFRWQCDFCEEYQETSSKVRLPSEDLSRPSPPAGWHSYWETVCPKHRITVRNRKVTTVLT